MAEQNQPVPPPKNNNIPVRKSVQQSKRKQIIIDSKNRKSNMIRGIIPFDVNAAQCLKLDMQFTEQLNNPVITYSIQQDDPFADIKPIKSVFQQVTNKGFSIIIDNYSPDNQTVKGNIHFIATELK